MLYGLVFVTRMTTNISVEAMRLNMKSHLSCIRIKTLALAMLFLACESDKFKVLASEDMFFLQNIDETVFWIS